MSATVRTSTCVDCATPIIGDRLRCPACRADHTAASERVSMATTRPSLWRVLLAWVVLIEVLAAVVFGMVLAARGCTP